MTHFRSAKVLLFDDAHNVLVLRRSGTHPTAPFALDLPGGVIEDNEVPEDGVARELLEETQLRIPADNLTLLDRYEYDIPATEHSIERSLYRGSIKGTNRAVQLSFEHDQYKWVPLDDLTELEEPFQRQVDKVRALVK